MARDRATLSFGLSSLLEDKEAAYEFLREYTGLELADTIRKLRAKNRLTQSQLAEILGTTQSAVARLEDKGYRKYSLATLQRVAEAFDVWPTVILERYERVLARIVSGDEAISRVDLQPAATDVGSEGLSWNTEAALGWQPPATWVRPVASAQEENTSAAYGLAS